MTGFFLITGSFCEWCLIVLALGVLKEFPGMYSVDLHSYDLVYFKISDF